MSSSSLRVAAAMLIAGCAGSPRPVPLLTGAVDSFEDADGVNAMFQPWAAVADGGETRASIEVQPGGFGAESKYFLSVRGVRPDAPSSSEVAGARVEITQVPPAADPSREERARDVSGFSSLALALRGTPGTYIVQLGTASVEDFDYFNAYVEIGEEWGEFFLPFSAFRQEGFGVSRSWTGTDVTHVAVYANVPGYFEFGIDDVRFQNR